jgi:adenosylmethionine-8-amino-7-oxononanoate aminotransferase
VASADHLRMQGRLARPSRGRKRRWGHFTRQGRHPQTPVPVITRGEGASIWDNRGRKILDGLSGLFVVQSG